MASDHYFSGTPESALKPRRITVEINGRSVTLGTVGGIFSPDRLDLGTSVLLRSVPPAPPQGDLLDLGCGWGPISLTLAEQSPGATVWAVDVNERALDTVRRNAAELGVTNIRAVTPEAVPSEIRFAAIWSNPPIRVGKNELHGMLSHWLPRLEPLGEAWLVVQRNLGSDSLHRWLDEEFSELLSVERAATSKGFRVLRAQRRRS